MLLSRKSFLLSLLCISILFAGCSQKKGKDSKKDNQETYFSVSQFLDDQWHYLHGQPITLLRVADFNGKTDSSYVPLDSTLWKSIRKQFDASDIGETRFLDQYNYTAYGGNKTKLAFMDYKAKNNHLFTRDLNIALNKRTRKIRSIFIKTQKGSKTYTKSQKLTYMPGKVIRIQAFEKSIISKAEHLTVSYYFN